MNEEWGIWQCVIAVMPHFKIPDLDKRCTDIADTGLKCKDICNQQREQKSRVEHKGKSCFDFGDFQYEYKP